eukprot:g10144.t1
MVLIALRTYRSEKSTQGTGPRSSSLAVNIKITDSDRRLKIEEQDRDLIVHNGKRPQGRSGKILRAKEAENYMSKKIITMEYLFGKNRKNLLHYIIR